MSIEPHEEKEDQKMILETIGRMVVHIDQLERDNRMLMQAMCSILNEKEDTKRPPPELRRYTPYIGDDRYLCDNPNVQAHYPEFAELVVRYHSQTTGDDGLLMQKHSRPPKCYKM